MEEEDLQQPLTEEVQQTDLEQDFANRELGFTPDYEAVQEQARAEFEENTALQEQMLAAQAEEEKDQGFLPDNPIELAKETGKAVYGGVTDAVESVGSTIDLLGDTIKTVSHKMQGVEADAVDNVFANGYRPEPIKYLDIPERFEVENESGLGKLTRGLVEFGALLWATQGVGGSFKFVPGATKAMPFLGRGAAAKRLVGANLLKGAKASRFAPIQALANTGKGSKFIKFIPKRGGIFLEGSVADLISSSSDYANMANLVSEFAPWFPFAEWLSVDPDKDNPWTARMKTVFAGGGFNLAAHTLMGFARGRYAALKARKEGKTVAEANDIGNIKMSESMRAEIAAEIETRVELERQDIEEGIGVSANPRRDYILENLDEYDRKLYQDLTEGNLPDTRDNNIYFHGGGQILTAKRGLKKVKGVEGEIPYAVNREQRWYDENMFGNGFYTTDDINVAIKPRKVKREGVVWELDKEGKNRVVYRVEEKSQVNLLPTDQKYKFRKAYDPAKGLRQPSNMITDPVERIMRAMKYVDDMGTERYIWTEEAGDLSYAEFIELIKSGQYGLDGGDMQGLYPRELVTYLFDELNGQLQDVGYGGLQYKSEISGRKHNVRVYWEPEQQLNITRADEVPGKQIKELEDLADSNGTAKGNPWVEESNSSAKQAGKPRKPTPDRNPSKFSEQDRSVIPDEVEPDGKPSSTKTKTKKVLKDLSDSNKATGKPESDRQILRERALRRLSFGVPELRKFIIEMAEQIADEVFKSTKNSYKWNDLNDAVLRQADEMFSRIQEQGSDGLQAYIRDGSKDKVLWMHDGNEIVTGNASQGVALQVLINTLAKRASLTAQGALEMAAEKGTKADLIRQTKDVQRSLTIALTEYKKIGYMYGQGLQSMNFANKMMPTDMARNIKRNLKEIELEERQFAEELDKMLYEGNLKDREELLKMWAHTKGDIRSMYDLRTYLGANVVGGRFRGKNIKGRWRQEAAGAFYNSILSGLGTPVNAIINTGIIGYLRPYQAWLGAAVSGNKEEMIIAAAGIDALGKSFAESLQMFKHNWDQGLNRKPLTYEGKFDVEKDIKEWKRMGPMIEQYGTDNEKFAYFWTDVLVDFNNSPWVRYSQNAMGAGDAFVRTVLGRVEMRMRAARKAIQDNVDLDDIQKVARDSEENFREQIFKQDKHEMWVVRDEAAKMAGDETTLTKPLTGQLQWVQAARNTTGLRFFFPFVRTGLNAIDLTWQHTPVLARFHGKWKDIMNPNTDPLQLLKDYGIRPEDIPQARALMKGRVASGQIMVTLAGLMALSGNLTGSLPQDKETRDLWRVEGKKPFSFKVGNTYFSYQKIEPFNTIFGMVANTVNYQHVLGEDLRDEFISKAVFMGSAVLVDKSMLAGVTDLADIFNAQTSAGSLGRTFAKFARGQFFPYAGLSAQIGDIMDANQKEANTVWETIFKRDAFAKALLKPKYDILNKDRSGQPWKPSDSHPMMKLFNTLSPVPIYWFDSKDYVKQGLSGMSFNMPEIMRSWKGEPLSSGEISQLQKIMSQGALRSRLDKLMKPGSSWDKNFQAFKKAGYLKRDGVRAQDQKFYLQVRRIFLEEKKKALSILRSQNVDLYNRVQLRQLKKREGKANDRAAIDRLLAIPK
tara:strand:- start:155 stop:5023 length:4869 start_codon:yes stop_codon:yes gene_type:complete